MKRILAIAGITGLVIAAGAGTAAAKSLSFEMVGNAASSLSFE